MTAPLMADISDPGEIVIAGVGLAAFAFYIGGDTPHVWDHNQINRQALRYATPVWVYGKAGGRGGGLAEGKAAKAACEALSIPPCAIRVDMEAREDVSYCDGFRDACAPYWHGVYGSASTVFTMPPGGAGYWVADWTGHPFEYNHPHVWATQYEDSAAAGTPWDWSELASLDHLWDRHAPATQREYLVVELPGGTTFKATSGMTLK